MQKEDTQFWAAVIAQIMASGLWSVIAFGAAGGATNALVTKVSRRDAIRLIILGAIVASGMGSQTMAALVAWFGLSPELVPIGGASGSGAYLLGGLWLRNHRSHLGALSKGQNAKWKRGGRCLGMFAVKLQSHGPRCATAYGGV